jgi:hypothetical protein
MLIRCRILIVLTVVASHRMQCPDSAAGQTASPPVAANRAEEAGPPKLEPLGDGAPQSLRRAFSKRVDVFGIGVYASESTPDEKVLHAANVLAQYLDNDEDGAPDNERVVAAMKKHKAGIMMFATEAETERLDCDFGDLNLQGLWGEETRPGGAERGQFDATLEEVLHSITQFGYAEAFPEVFGERPGTAIADAMDKARGGRFRRVPNRYPRGAWYTYYDRTCDYGCQITEYIYWGVTSILGAQDYPGRAKQIGQEWRLNTAAKVKEGDPDLYRLLTDPKYRFPTVLPDGKYMAKNSE